MRLIDADALMPKLKAIHEAESQIYGRGSWRFSLKCIDALDEAPTIELVSWTASQNRTLETKQDIKTVH